MRVTAGDSIASPAGDNGDRRDDVRGRGVLEQEAARPARNAPKTYSSRWKVVSTITFGAWGSARIRPVATMPGRGESLGHVDHRRAPVVSRSEDTALVRPLTRLADAIRQPRWPVWKTQIPLDYWRLR